MFSKKSKDKPEKKKFLDRFSKFIVFFCLLYGLGLTTVSYVYSFIYREPLVDLSSTIITTIVGPVVVWLAQNALCNIFEKNQLSFSTPITAIESGIVNNNNAIQTDTSTTIPSSTNTTSIVNIDNPIDLNDDSVFVEFGNIGGRDPNEI